MSIAVAAVLFGVVAVYAGWTNRSLWACLRGDNTVVKPKVSGGAVGSTDIRKTTPATPTNG